MLYARLYKMKEMSEELSNLPPRHAKINALALELGLTKEENPFLQFNEKNRYSDLLKCIRDFIEGKLETSDFEEKCRAMYTTSAYLVYTVDKLAQALTKQMQTVVSDSRSMDLIGLYYMDCKKTTTSARQEAMYRLSSESHVDDTLYRLEYVSIPLFIDVDSFTHHFL
jgi:paired amphipathic helix protein Sin3a